MKRKKKVSKPIVFILVFIILITGAYALVLFNTEIVVPAADVMYEPANYIIGPPGSTHHHSTMLIFINGELRRFDDAKYYESSPYAHIHDPSFAEIHTHATNVTLAFFLRTLNVKFNSTCLIFSEQESYCNNQTQTLKFYVEGKLNNEFGNHLTVDWEHYLITYGDESEEEIQDQIRRIPNPVASRAPPGKEKASIVVSKDAL